MSVCASMRSVRAGACHVESVECACSFRPARPPHPVTPGPAAFSRSAAPPPLPRMASLAASHADAHAEWGQTRTARAGCVSAPRPPPAAAVPLSTFPSAAGHLSRWLPALAARTRLRASGRFRESRSAWAIATRGTAKGRANTERQRTVQAARVGHRMHNRK